jgi:hypothetical protein
MQHTSQRFAILLALALSCWATPYFQQSTKDSSDQQKQSDKNKKKTSDNNQDKNKKKDTSDDSPFGPGKVNMLHSSHTGDSASAGFNGLTPNGEVDAKKLKEPPTSDDFNKAEQVSFLGVKASSLRKFIQDGKLNTAPPKTENASPKKG